MELNIIHDAQQLALEQGEAASNSEDDNSEDYSGIPLSKPNSVVG